MEQTPIQLRQGKGKLRTISLPLPMAEEVAKNDNLQAKEITPHSLMKF